MSSGGFHEGELTVQHRAGVDRQAARLAGMLAPADLDGRFSNFLAGRDFVVVTGRDRAGRLWISPILGPAGFLDADGTTLRIHGTPPPGDPLTDLPADQPVGLVAIDFATRRRVRVNGVLRAATETGLRMTVDQASAIARLHPATPPPDRSLRSAGRDSSGPHRWEPACPPARAGRHLLPRHHHPSRGTDASHRGGVPGFVRVDGPTLWWPDYPGTTCSTAWATLLWTTRPRCSSSTSRPGPH